MKDKITNIKHGFFEDIKIKDKCFYNILFICAVLTLSILISFWSSSFAIVTCVLACIGMFLIKGVKKIYILIYLLPFYNVIKIKPDGFVLCSIVLVCAILILGVEFIVDLIKKRKQINWIVSILFGLIAIYILLPFGPFDAMYTLKLLSTLAILYLVYVNKNELDFKMLIYILMIGFLLACCCTPLRYVSARLEKFLPDFSAYIGKQKRFSGLTSDPNYFAVEVLLLIACLTQLYFTHRIKTIFYPLLLVLFLIGFLTVSKAYFLTLCLYFILVYALLLIKKIKNKENIKKDFIAFTFIILLLVCICFPYVVVSIKRFIFGSYVEFDENNTNHALNTFTTGRSEIWIIYLKKIFSNPRTLFFGYGLGASLPITKYGETAAHNFYIECLYHLGVIGCLIIFGLILFLFVKTCKKTNRKFINFIPFIVITFALLSLNSLVSYRPYILISIIAFSLNLNIIEEKNTKGEEDAESINNNERI